MLLLRVKLDVVTLICFPVDTILEILSGERYSDIRALVDLSVCIKYANRQPDVGGGDAALDKLQTISVKFDKF